jgi:hypothetical protein
MGKILPVQSNVHRYIGDTPRTYFKPTYPAGWSQQRGAWVFVGPAGVIPRACVMDTYDHALSPVDRVVLPAGAQIRMVRKGSVRTTCVVEVTL